MASLRMLSLHSPFMRFVHHGSHAAVHWICHSGFSWLELPLTAYLQAGQCPVGQGGRKEVLSRDHGA